MTPVSKALLLENLLLDAYLLLAEIRDLKINLSLELQTIRDERRNQHEEFQEFINDLNSALDEIRGKHIIEWKLLNLINPRKNDARKKETVRSLVGTCAEA